MERRLLTDSGSGDMDWIQTHMREVRGWWKCFKTGLWWWLLAIPFLKSIELCTFILCKWYFNKAVCTQEAEDQGGKYQ